MSLLVLRLTPREMTVLRNIVEDHFVSEQDTHSRPGERTAGRILGKIEKAMTLTSQKERSE